MSVTTFKEAVLTCPSCGVTYVHQQSADQYWRSEDAVEGTHVTSSAERTTVDGDMVGNPSPRRYGLVLKFSCEACNVAPRLGIYQHKGQTFVGWLDHNEALTVDGVPVESALTR